MNPPNLDELFEKAREAQTKLQALQRDLALRRVEGSAGGGMVTAVATCDLRLAEVRIEPQLFEGGDREMLQDLVIAAVNAALSEAQRTASEELARAAGPGLAIPGMPGAGT